MRRFLACYAGSGLAARKLDTRKLGTLITWTYRTGFAGALCVILGILVSALFYDGRTGERYAFYNHYVSELGEWGVSDLAIAFNAALLVGATLLTVFLLGIARLMAHWVGWIFALSGLITGMSAALVGIYPMSDLTPHIKVAMTFFNNGQVTMLLFSVVVLFIRRPWFSKKLVIPGIVTVAFFVIFLNMPTSLDSVSDLSDFEAVMMAHLYDRPGVIPLAICEWLVIGGLMVWVLLTSHHLRRFQRNVRTEFPAADRNRVSPRAN